MLNVMVTNYDEDAVSLSLHNVPTRKEVPPHFRSEILLNAIGQGISCRPHTWA